MSQDNGYWILGYNGSEASRYQSKREKKLAGGKNRCMFLCIKCNSVWQEYFSHKKEFITYPDMPTYGLERKKCKVCIKKKESCNG